MRRLVEEPFEGAFNIFFLGGDWADESSASLSWSIGEVVGGSLRFFPIVLIGSSLSYLTVYGRVKYKEHTGNEDIYVIHYVYRPI